MDVHSTPGAEMRFLPSESQTASHHLPFTLMQPGSAVDGGATDVHSTRGFKRCGYPLDITALYPTPLGVVHTVAPSTRVRCVRDVDVGGGVIAGEIVDAGGVDIVLEDGANIDEISE